jgi:Nucleoside 2-deoxyribosyltransferase like
MTVYYPPNRIIINKNKKSIFLAGTIEMGKSEDWQSKTIDILETSGMDVDIYNPRRKEWDDSWKQEFTSPQFYQQVNWELDALEKADIIIINLLEDSKSPISLLELGLFADSGKLLVCCPSKFYRIGNIEIVCNKYNIPLFESMEDLINYLI